MVAHFSSRLFIPAKTALAIVLLWICVVGIQWFGYLHSVSHARYQQHSVSQVATPESSLAFNHSTEVCHLFDALTLASFIPKSHEGISTLYVANASQLSYPQCRAAQTAPSAYQSRAPPSPL